MDGCVCFEIVVVYVLIMCRLFVDGRHAFDMLHATATVAETTGLTNTITKEVEFGPAGIGTADHFDLGDHR